MSRRPKAEQTPAAAPPPADPARRQADMDALLAGFRLGRAVREGNVAETQGHDIASYQGAPVAPPAAGPKTAREAKVIPNCTVDTTMPGDDARRVEHTPPGPPFVSPGAIEHDADAAPASARPVVSTSRDQTTMVAEHRKNRRLVIAASACAGVAIAAVIATAAWFGARGDSALPSVAATATATGVEVGSARAAVQATAEVPTTTATSAEVAPMPIAATAAPTRPAPIPSERTAPVPTTSPRVPLRSGAPRTGSTERPAATSTTPSENTNFFNSH